MPGSILTSEVVKAVAVHQLPVAVTAVGVISHDTHLGVFQLLSSVYKFFEPLSSSPPHLQRRFRRPPQIVHSDIGELLSDDQNIPLTMVPLK